MSNSSKQFRNEEIERIRAQGELAKRIGKHHQTNPYEPASPDWIQWRAGYDAAEVIYAPVTDTEMLDWLSEQRSFCVQTTNVFESNATQKKAIFFDLAFMGGTLREAIQEAMRVMED